MSKSVKKDNPNAFKHFIGKEVLEKISKNIKKQYPEFNNKKLLSLMSELEQLELKPRVVRIREFLKENLPNDYLKTLSILMDSTKSKELKSFDLWPYTDFIQTYGLENVNESLLALKVLTQLFTAEFAIRPFLRVHQKQTLLFLKDCATDRSKDVRRWASEGCRPRLPWGERLHDFINDPTEVLKILELLKFDNELYVRKSVANNLNDIAKDHPELVIKTLKKWKVEAKGSDKVKVEWITKHALRTLIKQGHKKALSLIGVQTNVNLKVMSFSLDQKDYRVGENIKISFELKSLSNKTEKIVVDYAVHHQRANQKISAKVFKLKTFDMLPNSKIYIQKKHSLKPVTTRKYYTGKHQLEILINGRSFAKKDWNLRIK